MLPPAVSADMRATRSNTFDATNPAWKTSCLQRAMLTLHEYGVHYCLVAQLTISLKFPHTFTSCFSTGTIGAIQSENATGVMIFCFSNLWNSSLLAVELCMLCIKQGICLSRRILKKIGKIYLYS